MSRYIEDKDGDHLQVIAESDGELHGVTITAAMREGFDEEETTNYATVGPVDPHALIDAIREKAGLEEETEEEPTAEEAHQHLSEHWDRRMDVVQRALTMIPAPGRRGGVMAAFAGEEIEQGDRVEKALKIARFAADEHRDIPGVDR